MLGKDEIYVGAVVTYGDKKISSLTTQMPQAPQGNHCGVDFEFCIIIANHGSAWAQ